MLFRLASLGLLPLVAACSTLVDDPPPAANGAAIAEDGTCTLDCGDRNYKQSYDEQFCECWAQERCANRVACALRPDSEERVFFPTPCDVPDGWAHCPPALPSRDT